MRPPRAPSSGRPRCSASPATPCSATAPSALASPLWVARARPRRARPRLERRPTRPPRSGGLARRRRPRSRRSPPGATRRSCSSSTCSPRSPRSVSPPSRCAIRPWRSVAPRLRDTLWAGLAIVGSTARGIVPLALRELFAGGPAARVRRDAARGRAPAVAHRRDRCSLVFGSLLRSADPIFASLVVAPRLRRRDARLARVRRRLLRLDRRRVGVRRARRRSPTTRRAPDRLPIALRRARAHRPRSAR